MKKAAKIIGTAGAVALAAGLTPYRFRRDRESGAFELQALLWKLQKETGEEEDTFTVKFLPFLDLEDAEEVGEEPAEEPVEEPFAETDSDEIIVETAEDEPSGDPPAERSPPRAKRRKPPKAD